MFVGASCASLIIAVLSFVVHIGLPFVVPTARPPPPLFARLPRCSLSPVCVAPAVWRSLAFVRWCSRLSSWFHHRQHLHLPLRAVARRQGGGAVMWRPWCHCCLGIKPVATLRAEARSSDVGVWRTSCGMGGVMIKMKLKMKKKHVVSKRKKE